MKLLTFPIATLLILFSCGALAKNLCVEKVKLQYKLLNQNKSFIVKNICYSTQEKTLTQKCQNCLSYTERKKPLYLKKGRLSSQEYRVCELKESELIKVRFRINNSEYESVICKFKDQSVGSSKLYFKDLNSI